MPHRPKSVVKAASVVVSFEYLLSSVSRLSCAGSPAAAGGAPGFAAAAAPGAAADCPAARDDRAEAGLCADVATVACAHPQGCRRQSAKLPTARTAATAAVPAHGSHGGVN